MIRRRKHPRWQAAGIIAVGGVLIIIVAGAVHAMSKSNGGAVDTSANASAAENSTQQPVVRPSLDDTSAAAERVTFIGDSYSAGVGASTHSKRWTTIVAKAEGWLETNVAKGGTGYLESSHEGCGLNFCPNYTGVVSEAVAAGPAIVFVAGGRNDVDAPEAEENEAISAFFSTLRSALPQARIIVVSPVWDDGKPPAALTDMTKVIHREAISVGATFLDVGQPLRAHPALLIADGVHPNDKGHAALAKATLAAMAKAGIVPK
jgi:lysophospholipase L1-like esterase